VLEYKGGLTDRMSDIDAYHDYKYTSGGSRPNEYVQGVISDEWHALVARRVQNVWTTKIVPYLVT
jgi:hypothetical protein